MASPTIKIIADGAILETFKQALNGEAYRPGHLQADDTLIVDACANIGTSLRRSAYLGLRELDHILADPAQVFSALAIVAFETKDMLLRGNRDTGCPSVVLLESEEMIPFVQLPLPIAELRGLASTKLTAEIGSPKTWVGWIWRLSASDRVLRVANASYRHEHKNLIAALRIYLGALQVGHADLSQAGNVLRSLASLEMGSGTSISTVIKPAELVESCKKHRSIVGRIAKARPPKSSTSPAYRSRLKLYEKQFDLGSNQRAVPALCRVLMLDDQYETRGWQVVIDAIINKSGSTSYAKDWSSAQELIKDPNHYFDVMLLDCNLGPSNDSGLELLSSLRAFTQDLPLIMTTAYDNAELALWALRAGCNGFYAKELEDRSDRDSLDYYSRFREMLVRKDWEKELRALWSAFTSHLPTINPMLVQVEPHLRYAFYLLFSQADGAAWWYRGTAAMTKNAESTDEFVYRAAVLTLLASDHLYLPLSHEILVRARHPGYHIRHSDALAVLKEAVQWFTKRSPMTTTGSFGRPKLPEGCRLSHAELVEDENVLKSNQRLLSLQSGHLERSRLGALQLVLGHLLNEGVPESAFEGLFAEAPDEIDVALDLLQECYSSKFPKMGQSSSPRLVLIDDEGDVNGWHRALELVLGYKVFWHSSVDEFLGTRTSLQNHADLVLLDLWLKQGANGGPSPESGLDALDRLKTKDVGLPIIMLSAATDTVNAIKSLKRGALDYVPKWLAKENEAEKWKAFNRSLMDRISAGTRLGRGNLRAIWRALMKRLNSPSSLETVPELLEGVKRWSSRSATAADVVRDIREGYYQSLLPAIILYQSKVLTSVLNGQIPPLDAWRIGAVLRTAKAVDEDIVLFAGRASEYLGWVRCCIERRKRVSKAEWRKEEGNYRWWTESASLKAAFVWGERVKVKAPRARERGWRLNASAVLKEAIESITEFENLATSDAARILRNASANP